MVAVSRQVPLPAAWNKHQVARCRAVAVSALSAVQPPHRLRLWQGTHQRHDSASLSVMSMWLLCLTRWVCWHAHASSCAAGSIQHPICLGRCALSEPSHDRRVLHDRRRPPSTRTPPWLPATAANAPAQRCRRLRCERHKASCLRSYAVSCCTCAEANCLAHNNSGIGTSVCAASSCCSSGCSTVCSSGRAGRPSVMCAVALSN